MKFYKDSTGMCVVGERFLAPGKILLYFNGDDVKIESSDNSDIYFDGPITQLENGSGVAYADQADLLSVVNTLISGGTVGGSQFKKFSTEITRPDNTTVYSADDIIGETSSVLKTISNVANANSSGVRIYRTRIQTNDTGLAGKRLVVNIYESEPDLTGLVDNGPFSLSYTNALKRIGAVNIVMNTGIYGTVGMNDYTLLGANPANRNLYLVVTTSDGFTPSANGTKITVILDCELSN